MKVIIRQEELNSWVKNPVTICHCKPSGEAISIINVNTSSQTELVFILE
jgi:hypothetical protein